MQAHTGSPADARYSRQRRRRRTSRPSSQARLDGHGGQARAAQRSARGHAARVPLDGHGRRLARGLAHARRAQRAPEPGARTRAAPGGLQGDRGGARAQEAPPRGRAAPQRLQAQRRAAHARVAPAEARRRASLRRALADMSTWCHTASGRRHAAACGEPACAQTGAQVWRSLLQASWCGRASDRLPAVSWAAPGASLSAQLPGSMRRELRNFNAFLAGLWILRKFACAIAVSVIAERRASASHLAACRRAFAARPAAKTAGATSSSCTRRRASQPRTTAASVVAAACAAASRARAMRPRASACRPGAGSHVMHVWHVTEEDNEARVGRRQYTRVACLLQVDKQVINSMPIST